VKKSASFKPIEITNLLGKKRTGGKQKSKSKGELP